MNYLQKVVVLLAIFLFSCSHNKIIKTYELEPDTAVPKNYTFQRVQLTLSNGEKHYGKKIFISPDSTAYFDTDKEENVKIATTEISSLHHQNRVRGALMGVGIGLLAGATYGYLYWHNVYDDESYEECSLLCFAPSDYAIIFGGIGGLAGFLTGAIIGVDTTYEFQQREENEQLNNSNYKNLKHTNKH